MSSAEWYLNKINTCARMAKDAADPDTRERLEHEAAIWWQIAAETAAHEKAQHVGLDDDAARSIYLYSLQADGTDEKLGSMAMPDERGAVAFGERLARDLAGQGNHPPNATLSVTRDKRVIRSIALS